MAAAWLGAWWLEASGTAHVLHHHTIYHSGQILAGGLALLAAWQVMTAAMMLPGALRAVLAVSRRRARLGFLGTYFVAWALFAVAAFAADMGLHSLVHGWALAARYEYLIGPSLLAVAGVYELSAWKGESLRMCRRPGLPAGEYSRHCVAAGWALMLIMFSSGVANLPWMAALAIIMLAEKTLASWNEVRYVVGVALLLLSAWSVMGGL